MMVSLKLKNACKTLLNGKDMYSVTMLVEEISFPSYMQVGCIHIVEIKSVISHCNTLLDFLHKVV